MNCYLKIHSGNKAKNDIDELMHIAGFRNLAVMCDESGKVGRFFAKLFSVIKLPFSLHKGDVLLIQYPFKKYYALLCRIARMKGAKTITLIHDLGTFRRHKLTASQEISRLSHTDYIISHNAAMTAWLKENGCKVEIGNLEIFDYLSEASVMENNCKESTIVYAGGLGIRKNAYLYEIDPLLSPLKLNVYGKGLDNQEAAKWQNISYHGFMPSDDFIAKVKGDWGLVWDGDSVDGCTGNWGEYLKINNPHKTSFYLRAGLPVILWKQSAMAPFVEQQKIGIAVESLRQLPEAITSFSKEEYAQIKANAVSFSARLQQGFYFNSAFQQALKHLQD